MQRFIFLSLLLTVVLVQTVRSQQYDQLITLKDHSANVFYSSGHEERAVSIAKRVDKAMSYYQQLLGFKPAVTILILSPADWSKYTKSPAVYGMPHYTNEKTLLVAAEDNAFWKSFVPPMEQLPQVLREQISTVYQTPDSSISMQAFFDLLAIHELGHAFQFQAGLTMQRKWMSELFTNILLHSYIAENESESLPALTLFPKMVVGGGSKEFSFTSLKDIQERYSEIAQRYPKNYGWYQCRWHMAAAVIYDTAGSKVGRKLWDAFLSTKEVLGDKEFLRLLDRADKSVADVVRNWDRQ